MVNTEDAANNLPEAAVLEKWMMGTAKEADTSAAFLRRLLRMNPAYAQYLSRDEELGGIVQLFAKRFRHIILGAENPIQLSSLYKPICELTWRVVGLMFSSIMEMTDQQHIGIPMPKEAQGQVKMLLQTNLELSNKLSESRRAYLRELTNHRDKQRNLNEKTLKVIASLHEQPIMFYEPLEFVLDETTKEFVRECVEERVKLEMRTCFSDDEANREVTLHMEDLEQQIKEMQKETKKANSTALKQEDRAKKAELELKSVKDINEKCKIALEEKEQQLEELNAKFEPLEKELTLKSRRLAFLEDGGGKAASNAIAAATAEVNAQLQVQLEQTKAMGEKIAAQEKEKKAQAEELAAAKSRLEVLEARLREMTDAAKNAVEKVVYVDSAALQEQLDKTMTVEQELRGANEALSNQLEEEQKEVKRLMEALDALKEANKAELDQKSKKASKVLDQDKLDEEVSKAVEEISKKHEREAKDHKAAMEKLRADLESAKSALQQAVLDAGDKKKKKKKDGEKEESELATLRENYEVLMDEHEDLQHEYKKLEAKVNQLVEKLKEIGSADDVANTLMRIKLSAPPPRKKKKKKAFERLYDDAQRRIIDMRVKAERAERAQERVLVDAASKVSDRRSYHAVKALCHLQKAATATNERFTEAVSNFQSQNPDARTTEVSGLTSDGVTAPEDSNTTIPEESSPEWVVAGSQSEGLSSQVVDGRVGAGSHDGGRGRSEVRSGLQPQSRRSIAQESSPHDSIGREPVMSGGQTKSDPRISIGSDWQACASCGHKNSPHAKFCEDCGHRACPSAQAPFLPHTDPAANPWQSRDLSPALSPWRQSLGAQPLSTSPNKRLSQGYGAVGFPYTEQPRGSPGTSPQKRMSFRDMSLGLRHSAGEANLRFSGHRMSVSSLGPIESDDLPQVVLDAAQASSRNNGIDSSLASHAVRESSSSRRFVRLGEEAVLGGHKSLPLATESSPSRTIARHISSSVESTPPRMSVSEASTSAGLSSSFRRSVVQQRSYKDNPTSSPNVSFTSGSRSTPDLSLSVSSRQLHVDKDKPWDPMSRGRQHSKADKSPFAMRSSSLLVPY